MGLFGGGGGGGSAYTDAAIAAAAASYMTKTGGGVEGYRAINGGTAATVDLALANVTDITLNNASSCVISFSGATNGKACVATVVLRQDGTGGRPYPTWPGTVAWDGGSPPAMPQAASAAIFVTLVTFDGGSTWFGFHSTLADITADPSGHLMDGIETFPLSYGVVGSTFGPFNSNGTTGRVHSTMFTARKAQAITKIAAYSGNVAAAATPTLVRMGFSLVSLDGTTKTLVCETANVATGGCQEVNGSEVVTQNVRWGLTTFSEYQAPLSNARSLPTTYTFIPGRRYAFDMIVISSATLPQVYGHNSIPVGRALRTPKINYAQNTQTDIPTTAVTLSGLSSSTGLIHAVGLA